MKSNDMQMARMLIAVLGGIVAGILRIGGVGNGLICFALSNIIGSLILWQKGEVTEVFSSNMFTGLLSYILVWTLVYDVVHIF